MFSVEIKQVILSAAERSEMIANIRKVTSFEFNANDVVDEGNNRESGGTNELSFDSILYLTHCLLVTGRKGSTVWTRSNSCSWSQFSLAFEFFAS